MLEVHQKSVNYYLIRTNTDIQLKIGAKKGTEGVEHMKMDGPPKKLRLKIEAPDGGRCLVATLVGPLLAGFTRLAVLIYPPRTHFGGEQGLHQSPMMPH